jgi:hypothetical protein
MGFEMLKPGAVLASLVFRADWRCSFLAVFSHHRQDHPIRFVGRDCRKTERGTGSGRGGHEPGDLRDHRCGYSLGPHACRFAYIAQFSQAT